MKQKKLGENSTQNASQVTKDHSVPIGYVHFLNYDLITYIVILSSLELNPFNVRY